MPRSPAFPPLYARQPTFSDLYFSPLIFISPRHPFFRFAPFIIVCLITCFPTSAPTLVALTSYHSLYPSLPLMPRPSLLPLPFFSTCLSCVSSHITNSLLTLPSSPIVSSTSIFPLPSTSSFHLYPPIFPPPFSSRLLFLPPRFPPGRVIRKSVVTIEEIAITLPCP